MQLRHYCASFYGHWLVADILEEYVHMVSPITNLTRHEHEIGLLESWMPGNHCVHSPFTFQINRDSFLHPSLEGEIHPEVVHVAVHVALHLLLEHVALHLLLEHVALHLLLEHVALHLLLLHSTACLKPAPPLKRLQDSLQIISSPASGIG